MTFADELRDLSDNSEHIENGLNSLKALLREKAKAGAKLVKIEQGKVTDTILSPGAPHIIVDRVLERLIKEGVKAEIMYGDQPGSRNYVQFNWSVKR